MPLHGSAQVRWKLPSSSERHGRFTLVVEAKGRALEPVESPLGVEARAAGTAVFPALLPGDYELRLMRDAKTGADGRKRPARQIGDALPFSVEAENETRVRFDP